MTREKTAPPAPDPKPGNNPGYAEPQPRDKRDANDPGGRPPPNPDEGGTDREPEVEPDPARHNRP